MCHRITKRRLEGDTEGMKTMNEMGEGNKKEVAMKMLEKVIESIDKGKVSAIHLALKLHSEEPEEHSKDTEEEEEVEESKEETEENVLGACPKCANNRDKCKCE